MKGSHTLSVITASALKELMTLLLSEAYPQVFHCGHAVLAAAEELEQSDDTRLLKSYMDGIYNAIERLFYKEKIVLYPYLEKQFTLDGKMKTVPAVSIAMEEGQRASRMIQSFKAEILVAAMATKSIAMEVQLPAAFQQFEASWKCLCQHRAQLFTCFVSGSTTKV
ncbi:MAG: hypothetical protein EOP54_03640 [Sphingobacteriales bacterium]|nr:MAG: hypothetical protein EOP54_03640 [Sphingobacteriales bacterium]